MEGYSNDAPFDYKNADVRINFIRKVYILLGVMLTITFLFILMLYLSVDYLVFVRKNAWLSILCSVGTLILIYPIVYSKTVRRKVPLNYIIFFLFVILESYSVAYIVSFYNLTDVVIAASLTAAVTVALTIYAICTKTDFTVCGGMLFIMAAIVLVGSILGIFIKNKWFQIAVSMFSVLVYGLYLVYDTQLTIGKNQRKYSIDDYLLAALMLFIDIIRIFI